MPATPPAGTKRGVWHVALGVLFSSAAGGAYWPIAIRCPSLGPFPSIGGGSHQALTAPRPSSSSLPHPSLSTSLSFPLAFPSVGCGAHRPLTAPSLSFPFFGCVNGPPGLALFHFFVSSPLRGRQLPSPQTAGGGGGGTTEGGGHWGAQGLYRGGIHLMRCSRGRAKIKGGGGVGTGP